MRRSLGIGAMLLNGCGAALAPGSTLTDCDHAAKARVHAKALELCGTKVPCEHDQALESELKRELEACR